MKTTYAVYAWSTDNYNELRCTIHCFRCQEYSLKQYVKDVIKEVAPFYADFKTNHKRRVSNAVYALGQCGMELTVLQKKYLSDMAYIQCLNDLMEYEVYEVNEEYAKRNILDIQAEAKEYWDYFKVDKCEKVDLEVQFGVEDVLKNCCSFDK